MPRNIVEEILRIRVDSEQLKRHQATVKQYGKTAAGAFDRVRRAGRRAFNGMRTGFRKIGQAIQRNARTITRWAKRGVALALLAVVAVFGKAVIEAAKFSARMQDVANLTNASTKAIMGFRDSVLTMYQAIAAGNLREFATALYNINSAGFRAAKGLMVLAASSKLAIAAATSVDVSTRVLTKVLNIYRKEAELASDVTDMLVATVAAAESNLADMAAAIPTVLPQARASQIALEESLGVFAVLTKTANSPETAAVQFDRMINSLGESVDKLRELGLEVNDFGLTEGGLVDTIFQLTDALGQGNVAGLREIFNEIRGFRAVLGLLVQGQDKVQQSVEEVGKSTGETARDFGKMRQEATLTAKSIKNELHAALIELGLKALPAAVEWMEKLRIAIRAVLGTTDERATDDRSAFLEQFNLSPEDIRSSLDGLRNTRNELRQSLVDAQDRTHTLSAAGGQAARQEEENLSRVLKKLDIEIAAREQLLQKTEELIAARERDADKVADEKRLAEEVQKAILDAQRLEDAYKEGLPGSIREAARMVEFFTEKMQGASTATAAQVYALQALQWQQELISRETRASIQRLVDVDAVPIAGQGPLDPSMFEPVPDRTLATLDEYDNKIQDLEAALGAATIGSQKFHDITQRLTELRRARAEFAAFADDARDLYESFLDLGHAFSRFLDSAEAGSPLMRDIVFGATQLGNTIQQVRDLGGIGALSNPANLVSIIGPVVSTLGEILGSFRQRDKRRVEEARAEQEAQKRLIEAIQNTARRIAQVVNSLRDIDIFGSGLSGTDAAAAAGHAEGLRSTIGRNSGNPSGAGSATAFDLRRYLSGLADLGIAGAQNFIDLFEQELQRTGDFGAAWSAVLNAGLEQWLNQFGNFGDFAPTVAGAQRELEIFTQFLGGTVTEGLARFVAALLNIEGLTPELRKLLEEAQGLNPSDPVDKARLDEIIAFIASNPQIWGGLRPEDVFEFLNTLQGLGEGVVDTGDGRTSRDVRSARQITEITGSTLVEISREQLATLRQILAALGGTLGPSGRVASPATVQAPVAASPLAPTQRQGAGVAITMGDVHVMVDGDPASWSPIQVADAAERIGERIQDEVARRLGAQRNIRRG